MTKVAIFVEGHTETELIIRVLTALCGRRGINIEVQVQHGGKLNYVRNDGASSGEFFALVANCHTDGQVKSQILDRYNGLVTAGYTGIIGIRDVYPDFTRAEIAKFSEGLHRGLPTGPIPVFIHLAVMEVEAWFIDEVSHFERIHGGLTKQRIIQDGFDIEIQNGEAWDTPAATLNSIYKLEGLAWKKTASQIKRTIGALSMEEFYVSAPQRSPSLKAFLSSIEQTLFPASGY